MIRFPLKSELILTFATYFIRGQSLKFHDPYTIYTGLMRVVAKRLEVFLLNLSKLRR